MLLLLYFPKQERTKRGANRQIYRNWYIFSQIPLTPKDPVFLASHTEKLAFHTFSWPHTERHCFLGFPPRKTVFSWFYALSYFIVECEWLLLWVLLLLYFPKQERTKRGANRQRSSKISIHRNWYFFSQIPLTPNDPVFLASHTEKLAFHIETHCFLSFPHRKTLFLGFTQKDTVFLAFHLERQCFLGFMPCHILL
jgi:hypothetical protein